MAADFPVQRDPADGKVAIQRHVLDRGQSMGFPLSILPPEHAPGRNAFFFEGFQIGEDAVRDVLAQIRQQAGGQTSGDT